MSAIRGYDYASDRKRMDHRYNYKSKTHRAAKGFGYFFGIIVIIAGLFLFVGAMNVTIFQGLFFLIVSITVIVGGALFLRWVHSK